MVEIGRYASFVRKFWCDDVIELALFQICSSVSIRPLLPHICWSARHADTLNNDFLRDDMIRKGAVCLLTCQDVVVAGDCEQFRDRMLVAQRETSL